jgi:hypothetical protein
MRFTQILNYSYIKIYQFYNEYLGFKTNPSIYPQIVIAFVVAMNILTILFPLFILMDFNIFYYTIIGNIILFSTFFIIKAKFNYSEIVLKVESFTASNLKKLKIRSVFYYIISIILFALLHLQLFTKFL